MKALDGVYGVWANTDGFTVGEQKEIHSGLRLYEAALQIGTVKHFVWSNLDYGFKVPIFPRITVKKYLFTFLLSVERKLGP